MTGPGQEPPVAPAPVPALAGQRRARRTGRAVGVADVELGQIFTATNLPIILRNASFVGLVALGQTLVLLSGGIDLTVGAAAGLSAVLPR